MDLRRLSWGDWVAGACGLLLLVSLFLPWYSAAGVSLTAWQAMSVDDVILAVTACLAVGGAVIVGMKNLSGFSVATTSLGLLPAAVGLVVTVYRLVSPAPPGDVSLEIGAWLGLVAAVGVAVGAWNGANDEGPARRTAAARSRAAAEGLAAAELLPLSGTGASSGSEPSVN